MTRDKIAAIFTVKLLTGKNDQGCNRYFRHRLSNFGNSHNSKLFSKIWYFAKKSLIIFFLECNSV